MAQNDREATRRIVTDAEAEKWRSIIYREDPKDAVPWLLILLDTREELKEALEQMAFADLKMHDALDLKDMARRALSRLRGEA